MKELEIKLAGSHKGQIQNLPARKEVRWGTDTFPLMFYFKWRHISNRKLPPDSFAERILQTVWLTNNFLEVCEVTVLCFSSIRSLSTAHSHCWFQRQSYLWLTRQWTNSDGSSGICCPVCRVIASMQSCHPPETTFKTWSRCSYFCDYICMKQHLLVTYSIFKLQIKIPVVCLKLSLFLCKEEKTHQTCLKVSRVNTDMNEASENASRAA